MAAKKKPSKKTPPPYKRDRNIPVCYNCDHYQRSDQTCHKREPHFLPSRNDYGPLPNTVTQRPSENYDNPAIWGVWPRTLPNESCGAFDPRPAGKRQRPD